MRGAALLLLTIGLVGCSAPAATPQVSPADRARVKLVLEESGLVGTWGVDCSGPRASPDWEHIQIDEGGLARTVLGADEYETSYTFIDAARTAPGEVKATVVADAPDRKLVVVYRVDGDRQMTWATATTDGEPLITDGVSKSGRHSEWYHRCPNGIPRS